MTAGVAAQESLWGVQHGDVCLWVFKGDPEIRDDETDAREALAPCAKGRADFGCSVVASADGGRTWQPAGETP